MMTIEKALALFESLRKQTQNKSEQKLYNSFIQILNALNRKHLSDIELRVLHEHLSLLDLKASPTHPKKYYKQRWKTFTNFLKQEFGFITEKYYSEQGMIYGMIFGGGFGMSIGTVINPVMGISFGISIGTGAGMVIGMLIGAQKDVEAKKLGNVL